MIKVNNQNDKEEYYFLLEKLEEVTFALKGSCNDIDCDKYIYRDLLHKKYKPTLHHSFSCMKKLQIEKEVIFRIISQKKYEKFRYKICPICKKRLDSISDKSVIIALTKQSSVNNYYELKTIWTHKLCKKKFIIPLGWNNL